MLKPVRTVAPLVPAVTLEQAKWQCNIDHNEQNGLLEMLIEAATSRAESYEGVIGRALIAQTWRQDYGAFGDCLRLPVGDLIAVTGVTYYDGANALQTLSTGVYTAFSDARGAYLALQPQQSWPAAYDRPDAVHVTWAAGFGAAASDVPGAIRLGMLMLIGHWYANRETVSDVTMSEVPLAATALFSQFRRMQI